MSLPTKTRQWTLASHPSGKATYGSSDSNFQLEEKDLPALQDGQILVKTLYLSNDPAQRGWISPPSHIDPKRLYVPPVELGQPMRARGIGKVLASKNSDYKEGDLVMGGTNWREYAVLNAKDPSSMVSKADPLPGGLSVTHYLGALGLTGLTAYYGFVDVAGGKKGDRVVVSGAAGATGSMVSSFSIQPYSFIIRTWSMNANHRVHANIAIRQGRPNCKTHDRCLLYSRYRWQ